MRYLISYDIRDKNTNRNVIEEELNCTGANPMLY